MPIDKKFMLSVREAAVYFNIGNKSMRCLAEEHKGEFSVLHGNRYLIIRPKFEEYICSHPVIGKTSEPDMDLQNETEEW